MHCLGLNEDDQLYQFQVENWGSSMQVAEVIRDWQQRDELGRVFKRRDILRAVNKVAEIEGPFSERWIRWCILIQFDLFSNPQSDFYGCYRLKKFWPAKRFFVNTDRIPLN